MGQTIAEGWIEEGELRACKRTLRKLLEKKFQKLPEVLIQRIEATTDLARLEACLLQVPDLTRLDDLQL
jgi:hypothetical protein